MKQELGELSNLVIRPPVPETEIESQNQTGMRQIDAVLLELLVNEQRLALGTEDPFVADTLDRLAEHALNTSRHNQAEAFVRESIAIRLSAEPETLAHMRSLVLLGQTLARGGKTTQARLHLTSARKKLQRMPQADRLLKIVEHELKVLDGDRR